MNWTNILLDRFASHPSLVQATALVGHFRRNRDMLDCLSEDQAGLVRSAEAMIAVARRDAGLK